MLKRFSIPLSVILLAGASLAQGADLFSDANWQVKTSATNPALIEIFRAYGTNWAQVAALHTDSAYFRLNYGPGSAWGTSVDIMPSFWSGGAYYQGTPVTVSGYKDKSSNLTFTVRGGRTIAPGKTMQTAVNVTLSQPSLAHVSARVSATNVGTGITLDDRPAEAFKPCFISSMWDSPTVFDSTSIGSSTWNNVAGWVYFPYPTGTGWILDPSKTWTANNLVVKGGTASGWKTNAPSMAFANMAIKSGTTLLPNQVQGWITQDSNPNDDNVGFWYASSVIPTNWSYTLTAQP